MAISAIIVGSLLRDFDPLTLVRWCRAAAVATLLLNLIALWKQEKVRPMSAAETCRPAPEILAMRGPT